MTRPYYYQPKERTKRIVDFAVPADYRVKLKESEKKDMYLDLARVLKKLWNMKLTIIPIVVGALGTFTKGLVKNTRWVGSKRSSGYIPKYKMVEIG